MTMILSPDAALARTLDVLGDAAPQWALFDLDGTICDISHREELARRRAWDQFHAGIPNDTPNAPVLLVLLACYAAGLKIGLATGRPEEHRAATEAWLARHRVPYHELQMRPVGNRAPDTDVKVAMYADGRPIAFVVEDRAKVVRMWRERRGLTCFAVCEGDY